MRVPINRLLNAFQQCAFAPNTSIAVPTNSNLCRPDIIGKHTRLCSFSSPTAMRNILRHTNVIYDSLHNRALGLRSTFVKLAKGCWAQVVVGTVFCGR